MAKTLQHIGLLLNVFLLLHYSGKAHNGDRVCLRSWYDLYITGIQNSLQYADSTRKTEPDTAFSLYKNAFFDSYLVGYQNGIRKASSQIADFYLGRNEPAKALLYIQTAFKHMDTLPAGKELGALYWKKATAVFNLNQRSEAQRYLLLAAQCMPPGSLEQGNVFHSLGILYLPMQSEKALPYIKGALSIAAKHKDYPLQTYALSLLGQYHKYHDQLDSAIYYGESSLQMARNYRLSEAAINAAIMLIMNYNQKGEPSKGVPLLQDAESIFATLPPNRDLQFGLYLVGGDLYRLLGDYKRSEHYYLMAYEQPGSHKELSFPLLLQGLSVLYYKTQRYREAFDFYKNAQNLYYDKNSKEMKLNMLDFEIRYQTAEKDKNIIKGQLKIAQQEKQMARYRNRATAGTAIAIIIIITLVSRYLYIRQKNKHLESALVIQRLTALMDGAEMERSRLAHELHDGINSQLSALQTFLIAEETQFPFLHQSDSFQTAHKLLEDTASDVRNIAHNLAPDRLLEKGLEDTVREFSHYALAPAGIDAEIEFYGSFDALDKTTILNLYRIIQELIQNVKKHAQAQWMSVLVYRDEEGIQITVEDNGRGVPQEVLRKKSGKGLGLPGIAERIALLKGSFTVDAPPGKGTCIHISLPSSHYPEVS